MNVYQKLVHDLLIGDYLQVVTHVPDEDNRPECFRRVEKIEYIEALPNRSSTAARSTSSPAGFLRRQARSSSGATGSARRSSTRPAT
jgi:hypothetical protein